MKTSQRREGTGTSLKWPEKLRQFYPTLSRIQSDLFGNQTSNDHFLRTNLYHAFLP